MMTREQVINAMPDSFTLDDLNKRMRRHGIPPVSEQYAQKIITAMNITNAKVKYYKASRRPRWVRRELGEFIAEANAFGAGLRKKVHIVRRGTEILPTDEPKEGDETCPFWLRFDTMEDACAFIEHAGDRLSAVLDVINYSMWENKR